MRLITSLVLLLSISFTSMASFLNERASNVIIIETSLGVIKIELNSEKAPKTVENFKSYIDQSFFDGLIFHRVIKDFMIQGGGFNETMSKQPAPNTVVNESKNGLSNIKGSISMARTSNPHSGSSQFFINHKDNKFLDGNENKFGYTVFGQVIEGIDVVDAIARVQTTRKRGMGDVPVENVVIYSIRYMDPVEALIKELLSEK